MSSAALAQRRQVNAVHVQAVEQVAAEGAGSRPPAAGRRWLPRRSARRRGAPRSRRCAAPRPIRARAAAWPAAPTASSPISSRKSVPPLACSIRPARAPAAPVNAPRAWPNSSFSSSESVSAAQFSATNGLSARGLLGVDRARHQLFPGAGFAGDEHRARRRGGADDRAPSRAASASLSPIERVQASRWRGSAAAAGRPGAPAAAGRPPIARASAARRERTASARNRRRRASSPRRRVSTVPKPVMMMKAESTRCSRSLLQHVEAGNARHAHVRQNHVEGVATCQRRTLLRRCQRVWTV